jgi:hypothetical protein
VSETDRAGRQALMGNAGGPNRGNLGGKSRLADDTEGGRGVESKCAVRYRGPSVQPCFRMIPYSGIVEKHISFVVFEAKSCEPDLGKFGRAPKPAPLARSNKSWSEALIFRTVAKGL